MKHIKDLAKITSSTIQTQAGQTSITLSTEAADYIGRIFEKLVVNCPAWKTAVDGDAAKWATLYKIELTEALKMAGVKTGDQIKAGLSAVRLEGKPFLPAPGQFAKLCLGKAEERLSHNSAAYRKKWLEHPGQRQICRKISDASRRSGLERIREIRLAALNIKHT